MKTLHYFQFLFFTILFLCQCKKDSSVSDNNSANTGYVKEYYTNKPIANAQVGVYSDNKYTQLVENVYTDSSGKFVANDNISGNANILVTKQGYFQYTWMNWQTNRNNNIFYLDMPAYIQTHIKNVSHKIGQVYVEGFPEVLIPPDGILQLQGNNVDTTVCCIIAVGYKQYTIPVFGYPQDTVLSVRCTPIGYQTITVNIFY